MKEVPSINLNKLLIIIVRSIFIFSSFFIVKKSCALLNKIVHSLAQTLPFDHLILYLFN